MKGRPGIDLHAVARTLMEREGVRHATVNQSTAQVVETLRITLDLLAEYPASSVLYLLEERRDDG